MTYLDQEYFNWLESQNIVTVPIPINQPLKTIKRQLEKVNGILIPGGNHKFYQNDTNKKTRFLKQTHKVIKESVRIMSE